MRIKLALFVLICLFLLANGSLPSPPIQNLWDQVVRKEQVVLTVIYKGRSLNVWKQDMNNYTIFYVTPLCTIDLDSLGCEIDEYSTAEPRSVFGFNIKLWDFEVAAFIQKALKFNNIIAKTSNIFMLPMQYVRIELGNPIPNVKVDGDWRPFGDESLTMAFDLYPINDAFCHKMMDDLKNKTEFFLRNLKLYFGFSLKASTTSSRTIKITGNFLQNSSFYSKLVNKNAVDGNVLLKSEDANQLAHEVYNSATFNEEVSSDYKESENEEAIVNELLKVFKQDKIQSESLSDADWDSVFWDNIFTRPDIQTSYFNDVMKYDENENQFKFNQETANAFRNKVANAHSDSSSVSAEASASYAGFGASVGSSVSNSQSNANLNEGETKSKDIIKVADFEKVINDNHLNVKWTGKKFVQKSFDLYRVNTKDIKTTSETAFKRVIVKNEQSSQKIEIKKETNETTKWDSLFDETTTIPTTTTTTTTTPTTTTSTTTTTTTTTTEPPTTTLPIRTVVKCFVRFVRVFEKNIEVSCKRNFSDIPANACTKEEDSTFSGDHSTCRCFTVQRYVETDYTDYKVTFKCAP